MGSDRRANVTTTWPADPAAAGCAPQVELFGGSGVQGSASRDPLRIVWFTDPHVVVAHRRHVCVAARRDTLDLQDSVRRLKLLREYVAAVNPHAVLCTGDLVDTSARWRVHARQATELAGFEVLRSTVTAEHPEDEAWVDPWSALRRTRPLWRQILGGELPLIAPGNHDSMLGEPERLAASFGLPSTNGTSPFNRGLTLAHGDAGVRLLVVDSALDADRLTWRFTGRCTQATREWIRHELEQTTQRLVVLAMHHGPQAYMRLDPHAPDPGVPQFDPGDAEELAAVVAHVQARRADLRVACLFGHEHGGRCLELLDSFGAGFPGCRAPALVDHAAGAFVDIEIHEHGGIVLTTRTLAPVAA
jgi:hypothetical protein